MLALYYTDVHESNCIVCCVTFRPPTNEGSYKQMLHLDSHTYCNVKQQDFWHCLLSQDSCVCALMRIGEGGAEYVKQRYSQQLTVYTDRIRAAEPSVAPSQPVNNSAPSTVPEATGLVPSLRENRNTGELAGVALSPR